MLSPVLITVLIPTVWINTLPLLVLLSLHIILILTITIGAILLQAGISIQTMLEEQCAYEPVIERNDNINYDVNLDNNPGTKIYASLSFTENTCLMFKQYRINIDSDDGNVMLLDTDDNLIKAWNRHGDLQPF